jgi:type II secretory pathway component PulC
VVDLVLAALVAAVAYLLFMALIGGEQAISRVDAVPPPEQFELAKVGDLSVYRGIADSGLFGDAAKSRIEEAPPPVPEGPTQVQEPLRLVSTATAGKVDPLASAVIENPQSPEVMKSNVYFVGQPVDGLPHMRLASVEKRKVTFLNERTGGQEELIMSDKPPEAMTASAAAPYGGGRGRGNPADAGGGAPNQVTVRRQEVYEQLARTDIAQLYKQVSPELYRDANGNVAGITSRSLGQVPMARQFGFRDNDVVQTVNGVKIDSEQKVYEILNRFQDAPVHRIGILRDGRPQMLTVRLD